MFERYFNNREKRRDCIVLGALVRHPAGATALALAAAAGRPAGVLHPTLVRLERRGEIVSWWADGPYPRRRMYRIAVMGVVSHG